MELINKMHGCGYTIKELARAFNLSNSEVCNKLDYPVSLDREVWADIAAEHLDESVAELAELYNTTIHVIYKFQSARYVEPRAKVDREQALDTIAELGSEHAAAHKLGISLKTLRKRAGLTFSKPSRFPSIQEVKNFKGTQQEAAEYFDVSRSWIAKHAGSGIRRNSQPNKVKDWSEVLEYLKSNSLAATAKKFGISSSAICQYKDRHGL